MECEKGFPNNYTITLFKRGYPKLHCLFYLYCPRIGVLFVLPLAKITLCTRRLSDLTQSWAGRANTLFLTRYHWWQNYWSPDPVCDPKWVKNSLSTNKNLTHRPKFGLHLKKFVQSLIFQNQTEPIRTYLTSNTTQRPTYLVEAAILDDMRVEEIQIHLFSGHSWQT